MILRLSHSHLKLWFVSLLLVLGLVYNYLLAQGSLPPPIYSGPFPESWSWSVDSQRFVFTNGIEPPGAIVQFNNPNWFQYDVITHTLTSQTRWPLQPSLTSSEQQIFSPGGGTFIFVSPDGRFLVFAGQQSEELWLMRIADRQNQQALDLPYFVLSPYSGTDDFNILWSADSAGFIKSSTNDFGDNRLIYTSNFRSGLPNASVKPIDVLQLNSRTFVVLGAYDLSEDGQLALISTREDFPSVSDLDSLPVKLIVWNSLSPSTSQIIDNVDGKVVTGASFAAGDKTKLLLTTDAGLLRYDLTTGGSTLLNAAIKGYKVIFSPDARYVAIIGGNGDVTIVDLSSLTPTPTPNPPRHHHHHSAE